MNETTKATAAELVGTFALVFVAGSAVVFNSAGILDLTGSALAQGLVYAVMVWITLRFSGGYLNPAASIGLWVAGRLSASRTVLFVAAQLVGAVAAALLVRFLFPTTAYDAATGGAPALSTQIASGKGIVAEAVGAFFLVFALFGAIGDDERDRSAAAGIVAGLVLSFDVMALGPLTGGAVNPARWFGPALVAGAWSDWFVWILGPVAGAIVGAVAYSLVFLGERPAPTGPPERDVSG